MNYYPGNFYSNYPYQNNYVQQLPQQTQSQQQMQQLSLGQSQISNGLNGRLVESIDVARVAEVPLGSYGIFPKADLSEIYVKSWNNNGTTSLVAFRPIIEAEKTNEEEEYKKYYNENNDVIMDKMSQLEDKLNEVIAMTTELKKKEKLGKKELNASAY